MKRLKNKTAVITGGGKNIGKAISLALGREGANLIIGFHKDEIAAKDTCSEAKSFGCQAHYIQADIRKREDVQFMLHQTLKIFGKVDILINNASLIIPSLFQDIKDEDWESTIDTNLKGTFLCSQIFGTKLLEQQSGCIVNISSTAAFHPLPTSHHYVSSKAGIIGFTKALALTLAPYITVNTIAPGFVSTKTSISNRKKAILRQIPLGRFAVPDEIAKAVVFLVADGTYITGQTLIIDGGFCINTSYSE